MKISQSANNKLYDNKIIQLSYIHIREVVSRDNEERMRAYENLIVCKTSRGCF